MEGVTESLIKTLGVSAMTFVSYTVSKVKRFLPLVNIGLLSILLIYTVVSVNNIHLVLRLLHVAYPLIKE